MCQDFVEVVNEITFRKGNLTNFEVGDTGSFFRNVPLPPLFRPNDDVLSTTIELVSAQLVNPAVGLEFSDLDIFTYTHGLTDYIITIGDCRLYTIDQIVVFLNSKIKAQMGKDWITRGAPLFKENPSFPGYLQISSRTNFNLAFPLSTTRYKLGVEKDYYEFNRTGGGLRTIQFKNKLGVQYSTVNFLVLNDEINSNFYNFNGGYLKYFAKFDSGENGLNYFGSDKVTELPTMISSLEKLDIRFVDENYELVDNSQSDWSISFVFKRKYKQPDTLELKPLITNKRGRFSY